MDGLEWNSYMKARWMFRIVDHQNLLDANERECENLVERWCNPDLPRHLMEYMQKVKAKPKL